MFVAKSIIPKVGPILPVPHSDSLIIKDVYIAYYEDSESYVILMNDMSNYIGADKNSDDYYAYLDNLAKFHAKFNEYDVLRCCLLSFDIVIL